jgi:integrase
MQVLFGTLKKHRVIFRNPTARLSAGTGDRTVPLPLPDDELIAIATDATGPERRLLFVLAPIQALRATQMRQLRRDDIDVGNRRLSVNGHVRPLDDATLKALSVYLRHRRDRWPLSTNPHLLVSQQTAYEDGPISSYWIKKRWRGMTASLERIRRDRQVDELLATGPDPLHFMAVFGSSATTATLYADAVADMLTTTIEHVTISTTSDTD